MEFGRFLNRKNNCKKIKTFTVITILYMDSIWHIHLIQELIYIQRIITLMQVLIKDALLMIMVLVILQIQVQYCHGIYLISRQQQAVSDHILTIIMI